jgi:hypothetical protein
VEVKLVANLVVNLKLNVPIKRKHRVKEVEAVNTANGAKKAGV